MALDPIQPKGLGYFIYENMKKHLDNIAQINVETGESDTYRELLQYATRTAIELRNRGVKRGDIVASYSYNQKYTAVVYIATTFVGATITNFDTSQDVCDVKKLMELVQPQILFVCDEAEEEIESIVNELGLNTEIIAYAETSPNCNKFSEFIRPKENENVFEPYICEDSKETILILFSSGTTGLAKGICLNHDHILFNSTTYITPRVMARTTLYWVQGAMNISGCAYSGTARCYIRNFDTKLLWHHIEKYKIAYIYLTPYYALQMAEQKPAGHTTSLAYFAINGCGTSDENIRKIKAAMPNTIVGYPYGQTESTPMFTVSPLIDDSNLQTVGMPGLGYMYKVVDPETEQVLGIGQKGELRVKHKYHMNGYYKQDSTNCFDADGFLKTGDMVFYDDTFNFYVVDRYKEMFKYRGVHILPMKLENILTQHPQVIAAAVVGIPHEQDENHAVVVVSVKNRDEVTAEEIEEFLNHKLTDGEKICEGVKFVEEFPVTPSGKIARAILKTMVLNGEI